MSTERDTFLEELIAPLGVITPEKKAAYMTELQKLRPDQHIEIHAGSFGVSSYLLQDGRPLRNVRQIGVQMGAGQMTQISVLLLLGPKDMVKVEGFLVSMEELADFKRYVAEYDAFQTWKRVMEDGANEIIESVSPAPEE